MLVAPLPDGRDEIVATQFFTEKLSLLWNVGDFGNGADWRTRVIDDTLVRQSREREREPFRRALDADAVQTLTLCVPTQPNRTDLGCVRGGQGAAFDVRLQDLNMDGRVDLLVTNHQATIDESAVFAYELPANIRTGARRERAERRVRKGARVQEMARVQERARMRERASLRVWEWARMKGQG